MTATSSNTEIFRRAPAPQTHFRAAGPGTCSLTNVVEAAVRNVGDELLNPLPRHCGAAVDDARHLLAVLSWSYARQLYSSTEIQARLSCEEAAPMWQGGAPSLADIHRFRQENRSVIQTCVQAALRFLAAQKLADGFVTKINEAFLAAEADRRLTVAMFVDSMEAAA